MPTRRLLPLAALALLLLLGACGTPATPTTPVRAGVGASLTDLNDKVGSIAQDECATKPAATVFPNCPRFVTEVTNAATAVRGAAPGRPDTAALTTTATRTGDALTAFIGDGCVLSPSQPAPPATTCGPDLARVQDALRAMRAALATAAAG